MHTILRTLRSSAAPNVRPIAGSGHAAMRPPLAEVLRVTTVVAALCGGLLWAAKAGAGAFPPETLPVIDGARLTPAAERIRIKGVPTRIRQFEVEASLASARAFYRAALGQPIVETRVAAWTVLARKQDQQLHVVRLRDSGDGRVEGTLSESDLSVAVAAQDQPLGLRLPAGSQLSTDVEMHDEGRSARFLAWHSEQSSAHNQAHLQAELEARGYRLERRLPLAEPTLRGSSLWFAAEAREAVATVVEHGAGVTVTLNLVTFLPAATR